MIEKIEAIEDQLNKIGPKGYKTLYEEIRQEQPLLSAFFLGFKMDGYDNYLQGALLRGIFAVYLYYKEEAFFQKNWPIPLLRKCGMSSCTFWSLWKVSR